MLVPSFFDKLNIKKASPSGEGFLMFSLSKKSPKGGFFGKME